MTEMFQSGIPDILFVYKGKVFFIEIKAERGVVSPLQTLTIKRLNEVGAIAFVARSVEDVRTILTKELVRFPS